MLFLMAENETRNSNLSLNVILGIHLLDHQPFIVFGESGVRVHLDALVSYKSDFFRPEILRDSTSTFHFISKVIVSLHVLSVMDIRLATITDMGNGFHLGVMPVID